MTLGNKWVAKLHKISGIAKDDVMNTWYTDTVAGPGVVVPALQSFYSNLGSYFAPSMAGTLTVLQYAIPDTRPLPGVGMGPPVSTTIATSWSITSSTGLPPEASVVLSFHAAYGSIPEHGPGNSRPRARYRGRVFIGELSTGVVATATSGAKETTVSSTTLATLSTLAITLMGVSGLGWSVFSEKNWALYPVVGGWVDNSVDTTRRRKIDASIRQTWP
jgi:hypothetical protein